MAAPSELYNRLKQKLSEATDFVLPEEVEPASALLSVLLLEWMTDFPVLWHPEQYKKADYRKQYKDAWNSFYALFEEVIPKEIMTIESVNIPGAFYLDRHIFYQELLEEALGTKMPKMRLSKEYGFLKKGAPKKYSEMICLLNEEDEARNLSCGEELAEDSATVITTEVPVAQEPSILAIQKSAVQKVSQPRNADPKIEPISMVRIGRTKLSRGKAVSPEVKPVHKSSANGAAPGSARRITLIPSQSLLNWNQGLEYDSAETMKTSPLLSSEEQIQQLVNIECARALKFVKSSRIPFVPNYATTDYFQKRVAHHAGKLFEEIILWNKYQEMENKNKRVELFEENLKKKEVDIFPKFEVEEIVKGVPQEDESKQLPKPNPKKLVEEKPTVSKPKQRAPYETINFGFEQLGAIGKKLTAAIAEPAKAVAQMTIDFVEAELNAMEKREEAQLNSLNKKVTFDGQFIDLATDSKYDETQQKDDVDAAADKPVELNTYLQNPTEHEVEFDEEVVDVYDWKTDTLSRVRCDAGSNYDSVYPVLISSTEEKACEEEIKETNNSEGSEWIELTNKVDATEPKTDESSPETKVELEKELIEVDKMFGGKIYKPLATESDISDNEDDWSAPSDSGISDEDIKDSQPVEPATFDELFSEVDWEHMPMPNGEEECDCNACLRLVKPLENQDQKPSDNENNWSFTSSPSDQKQLLECCAEDPYSTVQESAVEKTSTYIVKVESAVETANDDVSEQVDVDNESNGSSDYEIMELKETESESLEASVIHLDCDDSIKVPIFEIEQEKLDSLMLKMDKPDPIDAQIEKIRRIVYGTPADLMRAANDIYEGLREPIYAEEVYRVDPVEDQLEQHIVEKEALQPITRENHAIVDQAPSNAQESSLSTSELRLRSVAAVPEVLAATLESVVKPESVQVTQVSPATSNRLTIIILLYVFTFYLMFLKFI